MPSSTPNATNKPASELIVVRATDLMRDVSMLQLTPGSTCQLVTVPLQDGIELLSWSGRFGAPVEIGMDDDSDRIHFTFSLKGQAWCWFAGGVAGTEHVVRAGSGSINFGPDRRGRFKQQGEYASVTVMVRPDVFGPWLGEADAKLRRALASGRCFEAGQRGAELHATAHALHQALHARSAAGGALSHRHSLWLQGQGLSMLGLFLEGRGGGSARDRSISTADWRLLLRARELLLSDLTKAPTLAELAWESGLSLVKLKRGFQQVFGNSVYNLFQQERMHEARRLLRSDAVSVTSVAADLGYTNSSHFAVAFRKQFGVNPAAVKRATAG